MAHQDQEEITLKNSFVHFIHLLQFQLFTLIPVFVLFLCARKKVPAIPTLLLSITITYLSLYLLSEVLALSKWLVLCKMDLFLKQV